MMKTAENRSGDEDVTLANPMAVPAKNSVRVAAVELAGTNG